MRTSIDRIETVREFRQSRVFRGFARQARAVAGQRRARGRDWRLARGRMIGHALAQARGLPKARHQAGRSVAEQPGRAGLGPVRAVGAPSRRRAREIVVAMDWTDFDADNQTTLALHLVTGHGRATPLLWLTVDKDELKNQRNDFEDACLYRLKEAARGRRRHDPGRPRLRRRQAVRVSGEPRLPIRHPLSRQHPRQPRPTAKRGWPPTGSARADGRANCATPRSPPLGRKVPARRLRPRQGHEGALVSGRQRRRRDRRARSSSTTPRRWTIEPSFRDSQGPAVRHGHERIADRRSAAP